MRARERDRYAANPTLKLEADKRYRAAQSPEERARSLAVKKRYAASAAGKAAQQRRQVRADARYAERVRPFLEAGCVDCGSHENLHFHHVDPSTKRYAISVMVTHSDEAITAELAKCVVVCLPCHVKRHAAIRQLEDGAQSR